MSQRVESVVNEVLTGGRQSVRVRVPPNHSEVQVVFDRTRFEKPVRTPGDKTLCRIEIWDGREYLGGFGFGDLRISGDITARPGQRMLWTAGRWPLPRRTRQIDIVVFAAREFNCLMHVDFLD